MGDIELLGLAGLALVDSTSFGTLVLPLVMVLRLPFSAAKVVLYLGTLALFYWALGVALLAGAGPLVAGLGAVEERFLDWAQLVVGVGLLVVSFWPETPWAQRRPAGPRRRDGWRERLWGDQVSVGAVIAVALTAGTVEALSMVPYLGAVAILTSASLPGVIKGAILGGYVVIMTLPALVLLALRLTLGERALWLVARVQSMAVRGAAGALWWVIGIVGFLLAGDAVRRLGHG